ncbi:MAG: M23 family peptidase, partial [Solirubrobacteraceae bacterium]
GNASAPHLHFHVMSSPSPLRSNGLPYTFTSFRAEGVLTNPDAVFTGGRASIDASALAGSHRDQLPLADEILDFP